MLPLSICTRWLEKKRLLQDDECWSEVRVLTFYLDVHIMLYIHTAKRVEVNLVAAGLSWSLRRLVRRYDDMDSTSGWFLYAKQ